MDELEVLGVNLPKNEFCGPNFKNVSLDLELAPLRYYPRQFWDNTNNFEFLGPNLPQKGFWVWNFNNLSPEMESASFKYYGHQI